MSHGAPNGYGRFRPERLISKLDCIFRTLHKLVAAKFGESSTVLVVPGALDFKRHILRRFEELTRIEAACGLRHIIVF